MISVMSRVAALALIVLISGCENIEPPTGPTTPAVVTRVTVMIRIDNLPVNATSVSIFFGYPANSGFGSIPGVIGRCSAIPLNQGPFFQCSENLSADTTPKKDGRFGAKVMIHKSGSQLSDRICEPMFLGSMVPIPCTGRDPLGDYATFTVERDGSVRAGY